MPYTSNSFDQQALPPPRQYREIDDQAALRLKKKLAEGFRGQLAQLESV